MNKGKYLRIRRNRVMDFLRSVDAEAIRRGIIVLTAISLLVIMMLPDKIFATDWEPTDNTIDEEAESLTYVYPTKEIDNWLAASPVWNERNVSPIMDIVEIVSDEIVEVETEEETIETSTEESIEEDITPQTKLSKTIPEEDIIDTEPEYEMEENYHFDYITADTIIKMSSGLTPEAIDTIFEDTNLCGVGQAIYDIEKEYGICAYFTMAVCAWESNFGRSAMAVKDNNICGILGFKFDSFDDCIYYFGDLMRVYEYECGKTMSPNGIGVKYCDWRWGPDIASKTNEYIAKANELFSI